MGLFGGKLPELAIQLERPDGLYYPGETVRAVVHVAADDGAKFKEIRAGLLLEEKYQVIERHYEGKGQSHQRHVWRTSEQWAAREQLAAGELPRGFRQSFSYEWRLPEPSQPYCQGKIVVARWLVKATVDRPLARDVNSEAPLYVVVPPSAGREAGGQFAQENSAPDAVTMRFELPRLGYVQGETVAGRLLVEPRQDLNPRALQISLLRHEVVPVGDRRNVENEVEARRDYPAQLRAGHAAAFDFSFVIPAKWRPTYQSGHARVDWRLSANLDLPWKTDIHAWQSIQVFNGAAHASQTRQPSAAAPDSYGDPAQVWPQSDPAQGWPQPSGGLQSPRPSGGLQSPHAVLNETPELSSPKFCRSCGAKLMPGALFCGNCGAQAAGAQG